MWRRDERHTTGSASEISPVDAKAGLLALLSRLLQRRAGAVPAGIEPAVLLFDLQIHKSAAV